MGITVGMDLANARALIRGLFVTAPHRPEQELASLRALAAWCTRFAPTVGLWPVPPAPPHEAAAPAPHGLVLDVSGTERLYRSEAELIATLRRALTRRGLHCRIAAASCIGCACAVALCGVPVDGGLLVPTGHERIWLDPLPLEAILTPSAPWSRTLEALHQLGLTTIGQLTKLPRTSLPSRFGHALPLAIDHAYGRTTIGIDPIRPRPPLRVERLLEGPTTNWEALHLCTRELTRSLANLLTTEDRGLRRLEITMTRADRMPSASLAITLCRPTRDVDHLWSMLRPHLERLDMGEGIEAISLTAARTAAMRHDQISLSVISSPSRNLESRGESSSEARIARDSARIEPSLGMLVDTLTSRLGPDAVLQVKPHDTHVPEESQRWTSLTRSWPWRRSTSRKRTALSPGDMARRVEDDDNELRDSPRPSRLFMHPERIEVVHLNPDGPPHRVSWRRQVWEVKASVGPERIGGRWWLTSPDSPQGVRDYYRVLIESGEQASRWLWIFCDGVSHAWHAHGEWA